MDKDQAIGGLIFIVCVVVAFSYTLGLFWLGNPLRYPWTLPFWLIAIPVYLALILILGMGAWIGWTMASTPPPEPIGEMTTQKVEEPGKYDE